MSQNGQVSRRRIGFLTSDLAVPFERELLTHALKAASNLGVELVATCGGWVRQAGAEAYAYDVMRRARLDGYLLCAHTVCVGMSTSEIAEFAESFSPAKVVIVGTDVPGFRCHTVSNRAGAAALTQHLITTHQRRRFAIVRGPPEHSEADARLLGCLTALESHQLTVPADLILVGDFGYDSGKRAAEQLLELSPGLVDLDAVVFANDHMAIAALDVFARARVSVPGAVSVVGFDDIEMAHLARTPLTTVRQPLEVQVDCALADLVSTLEGPALTGLVQHPTRLVLRRSCGCALLSSERISSTPPLRPGDANPFAGLRQYGSTVAADLTTSLRDSTLPRALSDAWAVDLVDSFVSRIRGDDESFIERIDATASALVQQDEPLTPLREAVLLLRRQLSALTGTSGLAADGLDDATVEALLTIGSVEALREAQRRRVLEAVAVDLASASAAISAAGSVGELGELAYAVLQRLDIETCVPVLANDSNDQAPPYVPFCYVNHERNVALPRVAAHELALPPGNAPGLLVVPMASQGVAIGYAIYAAKPDSFLLTTRLTLALGAALRSSVLKERLETAYDQIAQQALKDSLTGCWNRRYIEDRLKEEVARCRRASKPLSACIVDLDGFKQVNDRHGHAAGDGVLVSVAEALTASVRADDVVSRLGGDEFVVLLSCCDAVEAMDVARRIVGALNRTDPLGMVTASAGVATVECAGAPPELGRTLLHDADQALLEAKRSGKCRALHFVDLAPCEA
jgi:diguanylate cyclase (GGDEF)-like protein